MSSTSSIPRPSKFLNRTSTIGVPKPTTYETTPEQNQSEAARVLKDFREQIKKGHDVYIEPTILSAVIDAAKHLNDLDDRKMLLEHAVAFMSHCPPGPVLSKMEKGVIEILYNDLSHPPATYLGQKYSYRTVDGSYNNICDPDMGKAGMPYARSVQGTHPLPQNMLPDSGIVFDTLLKRDEFVKHPAGLSSLMFSFAALVIHTVFRTSHKDVSINDTSSYVDLAPLYGHNEAKLNKIRVRDGRGLLFPDSFAEDRLLLLPPAVCVLLVCFSRNHNYIARKLLEINERGTYVDPDSLPTTDADRLAKLAAQDEDIFQTARLCNCAWFGAAVFADYFGSILGLPRSGSSWSLSPFGEMRQEDHKLFERGQGNVCSVEFNCLYRWHATTSQADEQWVQQLMDSKFPNTPVEKLTVQDLMLAAKMAQAEEPDVPHWTFGGLQRQGPDSTFSDADLADVLKNATEHPASAFKARGTPHIMRLHEIMGIESNRKWGVCSLNEFRKFLGLKPHTNFKEWNPNAEIAEAAERLYGHIDNLELYVGLQAEEAKPLVDGAGLCPGYTISRAILSDAIALTRGDRFFTADFTPANMTAWGFADCQRDTPESMEGFLGKLGQEDLYEFKRPGDPGPVPVVKAYGDVEKVLKSPEFKAPYGEKAKGVVDGNGFFIACEDAERAGRDQREVLRALLPADDSADKIGAYFYEKTRELIAEKSFTLSDRGKRHVDIARDVLRYLPLHWVATELAGLQFKKDKDSYFGAFTESELYNMLTDCYTYFFLDVDASKKMNMQDRVKSHVSELKRHIKTTLITNAGGRMSLAAIVGSLHQLFATQKKKPYRAPLVESLFERGGTADDVTNNVLALLIGATVELSQCLMNVVNFYIDKPELGLGDKANESKLAGYVYEALRLDPPFRGVYREAVTDQTVATTTVKKGQRIFADLADASLDADVFPDAQTVSLTRTPEGKYLAGDGVAKCLGNELATKIITRTIFAVFEYKNIGRGPGKSGQLKRYKTTAENTIRYEYLGLSDFLPTAWPTTMALQYEVPVPIANGA
ncbi:hypothetical protein EWM64_g7266 [Hericium alpestre]|uniref:Linoleate 8R-lipoxygenase n=1 Tax=Hericium alpestre TaxID=135208 RepID=A0A4Y9ZPC6_9AGAM|nr:hypothetical protein EWM64_g7266 [Hericium alpestre]